MSARSILALIYTVDLLEKEKGLDCAPALARHGLDKTSLDPNSEIGRDRELLIFSELLPQVDDPMLGFDLSVEKDAFLEVNPPAWTTPPGADRVVVVLNSESCQR